MSDEQRAEKPYYVVWNQVLKDMKAQNNGYTWENESSTRKRARKESPKETTGASTWNWPEKREDLDIVEVSSRESPETDIVE
eukprot:12891295-Prorocentrum_lima.AAC.1